MNGKEIKIEGLTTEQYDMLEIMWSIDSPQEMTEWMDTLDTDEIRMVMTLKDVLLAHCLDAVDETTIAKNYLKKFQL